MAKDGIVHSDREAHIGRAWQLLAFSFSVLLGLAMIANKQLEGEATWFWYTILFHGGAKLYADLHLALQPLFVLEMNGWMNLFGRRLLVTETPAVLHLLVLCLGMLLLLRKSDWPDRQRAMVLAGAFVLWTSGYSYRFDDYHVTTESFILYSLVLLLLVAKAAAPRPQLVLAAALGVLCGLTITSRLNDGAALLVSAGLCLLVLMRTRKLLVLLVFVAMAALTTALILKLTGDSFSDYISNSFVKAVGSKGGTASFLADPFLLFRNSLIVLMVMPWFAAVVGAGALVQRYWKNSLGLMIAVQVGLAWAAIRWTTHLELTQLVQIFVWLLIAASYPVALLVVTRWLGWRRGQGEWDARAIVMLVPFAELASISVSSRAEPISGYYSPLGMMLLLAPVILPFCRLTRLANASLMTMLVLIVCGGTAAKIEVPYVWNNERESPMFVNRQWYRHPVYGPMYIDRDKLRLSESICGETAQGAAPPELLSLPFSYANYFCNVPPWHGYVETFFDISTRATIEKMIGELQTAPPQWIVYQRQLHSLKVHEELFNHGQPLAQRDLDALIMQKIASGEWQLVDMKKSQYGDGWYVVRTRP